MTALILSGMNFINLKQYSLSKWFQISWMVVNILSGWRLLEDHFLKNSNNFSVAKQIDNIIIYILLFWEFFTPA